MIRGEGEPPEESSRTEGTRETARLEDIEAQRRAEAERAERRHEQSEAKAEPGVTTEVATGSAVQSLAGIAGVVLAVLGLLGVLPTLMAAIAAICIGVALISQGGAIHAQFASLMGRAAGGEPSAGVLGGAAGIVLGVLALLGLTPNVLLAVAVIVFGATLLVSSAAAGRLQAASATAGYETQGGAHTLLGLGAGVLGLLALLAVGGEGGGLLLTLIGLLVLAAGLTLGGGVTTTRTVTHHAKTAR